MNVEVRSSKDFDRDFHKMRKRYKSLVKDLSSFIEGLKDQTIKGDEVVHGVFKYRMAISSKSKGKSGGARVITYEESIIESGKTITLLHIYDKSYKSTVSESEIKDLCKRAGL